MPETKIRVCEGCSISFGDKQYLPGEIIPLEGRDLESCIKNGFVEEVYIDEMGNGNILSKPLPNQGIWNKNPENLKDKTLEQLNTLILEIDSSIEPFETREEAIAKLTEDYAS